MIDHPRCATCVHWRPPDEAEANAIYGECAESASSGFREDYPAPVNTRFVAYGDHGYDAMLQTTADFYCAEHSTLKDQSITPDDGGAR